jgi:hypothetical protein
MHQINWTPYWRVSEARTPPPTIMESVVRIIYSYQLADASALHLWTTCTLLYFLCRAKTSSYVHLMARSHKRSNFPLTEVQRLPLADLMVWMIQVWKQSKHLWVSFKPNPSQIYSSSDPSSKLFLNLTLRSARIWMSSKLCSSAPAYFRIGVGRGKHFRIHPFYKNVCI